MSQSFFNPWEPGLLSWVLYLVLVGGLLAVMLFLAGWLGEKRSAPDKDLAYESGIIPSGEARFAFPAAFYLVAVFFLVFDLETAFIYAWAVAARELGLAGWGRMVFFVVVLLAGLVYVWAQGGLSWRTTPRRGPTA